MIELPAILGFLNKIDGRGFAEIGGALVLIFLLAWQGCNYHDCRVERRAYKNLFEQCDNNRVVWMQNAQKWEDAARQCGVQTEAMRIAAREQQEDLLRELRAARAGRRASELELQILRNQVDSGTLTVHELLRRVQGI